MHNLKTAKQKGFTLVEIAIVLVIIGLLLGGVLKGQELIKSAKVKAAAGDVNAYSVALIGYQDRYGELFSNGANYTTPPTTPATPTSTEMLNELQNKGLVGSKTSHALGGAIILHKSGSTTTGTQADVATSTTGIPTIFNWAICYIGIPTVEDAQALIRAIDGTNVDFASTNTTTNGYDNGRARLVVNSTYAATRTFTSGANDTVCFEL